MDYISLSCCTLAFVLYLNTLNSEFVYDDRRAILSNTDVSGNTPWQNAFFNDFWGTPLTDSGSHGSYRPLCVLTFRLNYLLGGFSPWGFHFVNNLMHCLATGLVVKLAQHLLPSIWGVAVTGAIFAAHPIHTEAVAGIVGRADLAACIFYLLTYLTYLRHIMWRERAERRQWLALGLTILCSLLGLLFKETAITSLLVCGLFDVMRGMCGCNDKHRLRSLYILTAALVITIYLRILVLPQPQTSFSTADNPIAKTPSAYTRLLTFLYLPVFNFKLLLYPSVLSFDWGMDALPRITSLCDGRNILSFCFYGTLAGIAGKNLRLIMKCGSGKSRYRKPTALVAALQSAHFMEERQVLQEQQLQSQTQPLQRKRRTKRRHMLHAGSTGGNMMTAPPLATQSNSRCMRFWRSVCSWCRNFYSMLRSLRQQLLPFEPKNCICRACKQELRQHSSTCQNNNNNNNNNNVNIVTTDNNVNVKDNNVNFTDCCCHQQQLLAAKRARGNSQPSLLSRALLTVISTLTARHFCARSSSNCSNTTNTSSESSDSHLSSTSSDGSNISGSSSSGNSSNTNSNCSSMISSTTTTSSTNSKQKHDHHQRISDQPRYKLLLSQLSRNARNACILLIILAFLTIPFLPATNLFFYVGFVVAERLLYLPSVGYCLLVGFGVTKLLDYSQASKQPTSSPQLKQCKLAIILCMSVVLSVMSVRTMRRNLDWKNDESLYKSAVLVNPPKALGNLGSILSSQARYKEAEVVLLEAIRHRPNMADVHFNLGIVYQNQHNFEAAIGCFQRAITFRPSLAVAYVNLGTSLIALNRCQEATKVLRDCIKLDGAAVRDRTAHDNARISAYLQLGGLHVDQGKLHRALAIYREALHAMPASYHQRDVLYHRIGDVFGKLQQWDEAEKHHRAALYLRPDKVEAHITYGMTLAKNSSRTAEAELWFKRAIQLAPQQASVHHYYAEFLTAQSRPEEAVQYRIRASELSPKDYTLIVTTATALRELNRIIEAESWYRKAVKLRPNDPHAHTNLGAILHLLGRKKNAADSYKEALRLQPGDPTALINLAKLGIIKTK